MTHANATTKNFGAIGVSYRRSRLRAAALPLLVSAVVSLSAISGQAIAQDNQNNKNTPAYTPRQPGVGVPAKMPRPIKGINPGSGPPLQRRDTLLPPRPPTNPGGGGGGGGIGRPPIIVIPGDRPWGNGPGGTGYPWWWDGGTTVDGQASEDHWRVRAHLGSPVVQRAKRWYWWRYPYWGYSHWTWWNNWPRYPIGYGWDYTDSFLEIQAQREYERLEADRDARDREEAERFERLSDLEKGNELLATGDSAGAAGYYVKHLESAKDDAEAMRSLALALVSSGKVDQACAMMLMAYEKSPTMASLAIDPDRIAGTVLDYRKLITDTVTYAHKVKSASAWLTATALTQGEGRLEVAKSMLGRAKAAGLSGEPLRQFEIAFGVTPTANATK